MQHSGTRLKYRSNRPANQRFAKQNREHQREFQDQNDELLALASIYDHDVFHVQDGAYCGHFCAHIELPSSLHIKGIESLSDKNESQTSYKEFFVEFLPPIVLKFRLPNNYPSQAKPHFQLHCKWLNEEQLSRLCRRLDKLWYENLYEVVLFRWTEYLQKESLAALNITDSLDLSWALRDLKSHILPDKQKVTASASRSREKNDRSDDRARPFKKNHETSDHRRENYKARLYRDRRAFPEENLASLLPSLIEFNQIQLERRFISKLHYCNICLEEKIGSCCTRFKDCGHDYCKECIKSYFEVQILEGKVTSLTCPYEKCKTQAVPSQVRELVNEELFSKYDRLLLSTTLDSMTDIQYCPRTLCQCAVVIEPKCTMGTCPACFFVFCIFCRMSYHGVEACKMKSEERRLLYEKYHNGTEEEKRVMESRYGKLQLKHLVDTILSDSWVDENSKQCPHCRSNIEKIDGCNKMSCWKCNKYFCWTCMNKLSETDPYKHYEDPKASCFNRLYTGAFAEVEEEEVEDFGGSESDDDDD